MEYRWDAGPFTVAGAPYLGRYRVGVVHVVGRNASNTEPARFVVVLLKGKGAPIVTLVKE